MNKQDLITKVMNSTKTTITHADAERAVNAVLDSIKEAVSAGDSVQLVGFGTFDLRQRAAKEGRNPTTGEKIQIPAKKVPGFKPGKAFKDAVNK